MTGEVITGLRSIAIAIGQSAVLQATQLSTVSIQQSGSGKITSD